MVNEMDFNIDFHLENQAQKQYEDELKNLSQHIRINEMNTRLEESLKESLRLCDNLKNLITSDVRLETAKEMIEKSYKIINALLKEK